MSILGIALPIGGLLLGAGGIALKLFAPGLVGTIEAGAVGIAKGIPPKAWLAIGAALLLVAGVFFHQHKAHAELKAAYAAGAADDAARWKKALDQAHAEAVTWRQKAEAAAAAISTQRGAQHDQDLRDIGARADDQRLRGPGKAAAASCGGQGDHPGLPAGAGGHDAAAGTADAGLGRVPADEGYAIVRWSDLVAWAAVADGWRSEVMTWRGWHGDEAELNRQQREGAPPVPTTPAPPVK